MTGLTYFVIAGVAFALLAVAAAMRWAATEGSDAGTIAGGIAIIGVIAAVISFMIALIGVTERVMCGDKAEALGRDSRWAVGTGCLVESDDGIYVPLDKLRITDIEDDQ